MARAICFGWWNELLAPGQVIVFWWVSRTLELRLREVFGVGVRVNHAFMVAADGRASIRSRVLELRCRCSAQGALRRCGPVDQQL